MGSRSSSRAVEITKVSLTFRPTQNLDAKRLRPPPGPGRERIGISRPAWRRPARCRDRPAGPARGYPHRSGPSGGGDCTSGHRRRPRPVWCPRARRRLPKRPAPRPRGRRPERLFARDRRARRRAGDGLRPRLPRGVSREPAALVALAASSCSPLVGVVVARDPSTFLASWELITLVPAAAILVRRSDAPVRARRLRLPRCHPPWRRRRLDRVLALAHYGALGDPGALAAQGAGVQAFVIVAAIVGFGTKAGPDAAAFVAAARSSRRAQPTSRR